MKATRVDTTNTLLLLQVSTKLLLWPITEAKIGLEVDLAARGSWAFSFINSSIKSKLPFFQIQTRSSKSLQSVEKALSKLKLAQLLANF